MIFITSGDGKLNKSVFFFFCNAGFQRDQYKVKSFLNDATSLVTNVEIQGQKAQELTLMHHNDQQ